MKKKHLFIGLSFIILAVFIGGITLTKSFSKTSQEEKGMLAPDFTLQDLQGKKVTLSQLHGKIVFLNFWATWCPPCLYEMPSIEKLYQATKKDKNFVILAVSVDQAARKEIQKFALKNKFTFLILHDPQNEVGSRYGVRGIPVTFILDKQGMILTHQIGPRDWSNKDFLNILQKLLKS